MNRRGFLKGLFAAGAASAIITLCLNLHVDSYGSGYQLRLFGYANYCPQSTNLQSGLSVPNHYNFGKTVGIRLPREELNPNQPTAYMCVPHSTLFLKIFPGTEIHND